MCTVRTLGTDWLGLVYWRVQVCVYRNVFKHVHENVNTGCQCCQCCFCMSMHMSLHMSIPVSMHMSIHMPIHGSMHMCIHIATHPGCPCSGLARTCRGPLPGALVFYLHICTHVYAHVDSHADAHVHAPVCTHTAIVQPMVRCGCLYTHLHTYVLACRRVHAHVFEHKTTDARNTASHNAVGGNGRVLITHML